MATQSPTYPFFQIIVKGPRPNRSVTLPIGLAAQFAGAPTMEGTPAADQDASGLIALSDGSKLFAGFITRDVLAAVNGVPAVPVPTYSELSTGGNPNLPFENAFSAGLEASIEDADQYEAEGVNMVSSGNGARDITAATAIGTALSFYVQANGISVTCVAQTGNYSEFQLAEIQTPSVAGNVRIRARKVYGKVD
jgi:hypothetical protein